MPYTVVVTERAAANIEEAATWWARERSVEQASHWYSKVRKAIDGLATDPQRHGLAAESSEFPYELRELHIGLRSRGTHRVLFSVAHSTVVVLTVRHVAQRPVTPHDF